MIYTGESALDFLAGQLNDRDPSSSSYWNEVHSTFKFTGSGFEGLVGIGGTRGKYSGILKLARLIFQFPFRMIGYKNFNNSFAKFDRVATIFTSRQNKEYDLGVLRHTLTLSFLAKHAQDFIGTLKTVCIIGDGLASMTSQFLANDLAKNVILVNLNKTLLVDLWYLKKLLGDKKFESNVVLITDKTDLVNAEIFFAKNGVDHGRVIAIRAIDHIILRSAPIDVIVNIASMQEMDKKVIDAYFEDFFAISEKKDCVFYCCNRESKTLPDGSEINFSEYPWRDQDQIIVDELCPWHQYYYHPKFPFYLPLDGVHRHRLSLFQSSHKNPMQATTSALQQSMPMGQGSAAIPAKPVVKYLS